MPKGETELASTAGAGSLVLEFEVLSALTGDVKYGKAAMRAAEAIYDRRSELGLVGKHIHVKSGKWHETLSGVGSNSDSFYEYLLKAYLLFRRKEYYDMFSRVFRAVKEHSMSGDWFVDVDMYSGKMRKKRSENLQAFWPGMEAMLGMTESSTRLLNSFYIVWSEVGFLPEEFDYLAWAPGKSGAVSQLYPLRPELIESTYLQYRATADRSWLLAGREFLLSLETHTRTSCGYATVKDVMKRELEDSMPSFFLSETCKYLYLLFDETNFIHDRGYIFTTEAHPIDPLQLARLQTISKTPPRGGEAPIGLLDIFDRLIGKLTEIVSSQDDDVYVPETSKDNDDEEGPGENHAHVMDAEYFDWRHGRDLHSSHLKCPKPEWWNHRPYVSAKERTAAAAGADESEGINQEATSIASIQRLFAMLSGKVPQQQAVEVDSLDPKYECSVDDDPKLTKQLLESPVLSDSSSNKILEIDADSLGKFIVSIFPDGFIIKSTQYGNTIEIAGVGERTVYVKEYNKTHSSAVSASSAGQVSTCSVRMQVAWPPDASGDTTGKSVWGASDYPREFLPQELEKERYVSWQVVL